MTNRRLFKTLAKRVSKGKKGFKAWISQQPKASFRSAWSFSQVMEKVPNENDRYKYFQWLFRSRLDHSLVAHRRYFASEGRGFGDDAFHAMWEKLLSEFAPLTMLEIGVYRGQTLSLWHLISGFNRVEAEIWGVSPLENLGDEVSEYADLDYEQDIRDSFSSLGISNPNLFKGKSQDIAAVDFIKSKVWDLVYIDGSHDVEDVRRDAVLAGEVLRSGGILVLDDASVGSSYTLSFPGWPGPSEVAAELSSGQSFALIGTCGHNRVFQKVG